MKTANAGTPPTPKMSKRDLIQLLNQNTTYWETVRVTFGKWHASASRNSKGRRTRASATSERKAMQNLCQRLGLL